MKYRVVFISIICGLIGCTNLYAQSMRSAVKEANKLYDQEQYEEALQKYMDIEVEHPGEPILDFNIGNTLYQQGRFDEAVEHYHKTALNGDNQLRAQANYNIGNSYYQKALQTESTGKLDESIEQMREGIEYYKSALKQQPEDTDIKYNIEFVQQEIKRLLDKIKEQQQQQQGQQGQQQQQGEQGEQQEGQQGQGQQQQGDQGQQGKDKQQGQQGEEEKQQQGQQGQEDEQDQKDKEQGKAFQADNDSAQDQQQQGQQGKKEAEELTEQEAARLLDTLPEADKRKKGQPPRKGYLGEVEKNW